MKHTLHILKDAKSTEAQRLITEQAAGGIEGIEVLLIQEAVRLKPSFDVPIYVLEEDLKARDAVSPFQAVDYAKMLEMIFTADAVMTW